MNSVFENYEEDMVFEYEENKKNCIETMLFEENSRCCMYDEWISMWEDFANLKKWERALWQVESTEIFKQRDIFKSVLSNLKMLKKNREDLFDEIFEKGFVTKLLFEMGKNVCNMECNKKSVKALINWISKNLTEPIMEEDFWEIIRDTCLFEDYTLFDLANFAGLWSSCFKEKIVVDFVKIPELITFLFVRVSEMDNAEIFLEEMKFFLYVVDGIRGNKMLLGKDMEDFKIKFIEWADEELMYMALKKNFIGMDVIKRIIDCAVKQNRCDLLPLLILKKNGEWPEEELFREKADV